MTASGRRLLLPLGGSCLLGFLAGWTVQAAMGPSAAAEPARRAPQVAAAERAEPPHLGEATSSRAVRTSASADRRVITRLSDADAGVRCAERAQDLGACFEDALHSSTRVISTVRGVDVQARADCLVRHGLVDVRAAPEPRSVCGDLSEELWSSANDRLAPLLVGIRDLAGGRPITGVFADADCTRQSDAEFAAGLHFASLAPRWVAPEYIACAVHREAHTGTESFALWSALDAARANGSVAPLLGDLDGSQFNDARTQRRIAGTLDRPDDPSGTR